MKKIFGIVCLLYWHNIIFSQSFAINNDGSTAHSSAILDVKSDTKGALFPRLTKTQKNAITSPAPGLLVYQISPDSIGFHYYNGTQWLWLEALENKVWKTNGNTGTDTAINFIGTSDNMPLRFKQNNINIGEWNRNKRNYFIGSGAGNYNTPANGHIAIGDSTGTFFNGSTAPGVLIGNFAGKSLINGFNPVMIGIRAGEKTTTGSANVFVGSLAGRFNTIGVANTYIGHQAGDSATIGNDNTSIGATALSKNKKGSANTAIGYNANVGKDSLVNISVIGANAFVDTSNAMVLGSINGINGAVANTNVAIGTTKPVSALHVSRGNSGSVFTNSNRIVTLESNVSNYVQLLSPNANETGILAGNASTLIKSGIIFTADSSIVLRAGGNTTRIIIQDTGNVGIGNNFPQSKLSVNGSLALPIRSITTAAEATLTSNDYTLIINASTTLTITLPLSTTATNRQYILVNQDAFTHNTNFFYRDFTNTTINTIPANSSITLQSGPGGFWYRVQ